MISLMKQRTKYLYTNETFCTKVHDLVCLVSDPMQQRPPVTLPEQVTCGRVPSGKTSKGEVEIHRKAGGHLGALTFK